MSIKDTNVREYMVKVGMIKTIQPTLQKGLEMAKTKAKPYLDLAKKDLTTAKTTVQEYIKKNKPIAKKKVNEFIDDFTIA